MNPRLISDEAEPGLAMIHVDTHSSGLFATHNMPCAVCQIKHAVLNLNEGTYGPCWKCRDFWELRRVPWYRKLFSREQPPPNTGEKETER